MTGVFIGSALWWVALFAGMTLLTLKFSSGLLGWIHRVTGVVIVVFGVVVLSLSPLKHIFENSF